MMIIWHRWPEHRDRRGRVLAWHDVAHCVVRYACEGDPASMGCFELETRVRTLLGNGWVLRIDPAGYLGVVLDREDPTFDCDQPDLLYFRMELCTPLPKG